MGLFLQLCGFDINLGTPRCPQSRALVIQDRLFLWCLQDGWFGSTLSWKASTIPIFVDTQVATGAEKDSPAVIMRSVLDGNGASIVRGAVVGHA